MATTGERLHFGGAALFLAMRYAREMKKLVSILVFGALSCVPSILTPPTGPGTDYPCGIQGLSCGGGNCCWQGDVCGGPAFSGCPKDYCCVDDSDAFGAAHGVVKKAPYHQMFDQDLLNSRIVRE